MGRKKRPTSIDAKVLEFLVEQGMLDISARGIPPLTVDEISTLIQYLDGIGAQRSNYNYHKEKLEKLSFPIINLERPFKEQIRYIQWFEADQDILVSTRPIAGYPITHMDTKHRKPSKMTNKELMEAYVLRDYEQVMVKDLAGIYEVTSATVSRRLSEYRRGRQKNIVERHFDAIREKYDLPEDAMIITKKETAARLNVWEGLVLECIRSGLIRSYSDSVHAISYPSVKELIWKPSLGNRLLKGAEFFYLVNWDVYKNPWRIAEDSGIYIVAVTPRTKEELDSQSYYRRCRIPESQIEVARNVVLHP